jgi:hypothetical protein
VEIAFLALLVGHATPLVPVWIWARWLRRRTGAPRFASWTAYALIGLGALFALVGAASLVLAYSAPPAPGYPWTEPAGKARVLAEGISASLNCGAIEVLIALLATAWLLFCTYRWHWRVRRPTVGDPPYR